MLEKKKCVICNNDVIVHNCHYKCDKCGFAENCHDIPHIIDLAEFTISFFGLFLSIFVLFIYNFLRRKICKTIM